MTFITLAVIASNIMGYKLAIDIAKPVKACAERLNKLGQGDLASEVITKAKYDDETKMLADATKGIVADFNTIINDQSYMLGEIAQGNFDIESQSIYKFGKNC